MCGFSKWKRTPECFGNYQKNNSCANSVSFYERLLDERSGKFISVGKQLDFKKNAQAELNMEILIPIIILFFFRRRRDVIIKYLGLFYIHNEQSANERNFREHYGSGLTPEMKI